MPSASLLVWLPISLDLVASGYLTLLSVASLSKPRPAPQLSTALPTRFAVVVPAHNEEAMLRDTLESILAQDYPTATFEVHVIADNCTDTTADVARSAGRVMVHERHDLQNTGKGAALAWLLDQLVTSADVDAFVFIDADTTVDSNFLQVMHERVGAGAECLQASYRVGQPDSHPLVSLRALAFAMFHDLRGRGKARLGLSSGLWGNGMVMKREALQQVPWRAFSATEDAEQHLRLVIAGKKVEYEGRVCVFGYMPANLSAARAQQKRWEGGRSRIARNYWKPLLASAVKQRSLVPLATLVDVALPPLSLHLLLAGALVPVGLAVDGEAAVASVACVGGLGVYLCVGIAQARLPRKAYVSLLYAPGYIAWKTALFTRELFRRSEPEWVRTARAP